jgi:hypothetical protein
MNTLIKTPDDLTELIAENQKLKTDNETLEGNIRVLLNHCSPEMKAEYDFDIKLKFGKIAYEAISWGGANILIDIVKRGFEAYTSSMYWDELDKDRRMEETWHYNRLIEMLSDMQHFSRWDDKYFEDKYK